MKRVNEPQPDLRRLYLPIYPKAFISAARLNRERDRVFVSMPFGAPHSAQIWKLLHGVAEIHGFNITRVDERPEPSPIVSDILEEIERAEIILVDLAGLNPNVLYELGIAHVRCASVVLLCPRGQALPFNLAAIRCIFYDVTTHAGQVELSERLGKTLTSLRSVGPPTIIPSAIERTETLVSDLQMLAELSNEELATECVWLSGSLSAFAIDEHEKFGPEESEYRKALLKEKATLLSLARRGCSIRCIITPPASALVVPRIDVMTHRLICLLRLLESKDHALDHTHFVVSPFRQKNLYIVGHISCLEGYKQGIQRGFGLNLRQTDMNAILNNISVYEALFDHLEAQTLIEFGTHAEDRRTALRLATIRCLRQSLKVCQSPQGTPVSSRQPGTQGRKKGRTAKGRAKRASPISAKPEKRRRR